jgi:hypothetical protein
MHLDKFESAGCAALEVSCSGGMYDVDCSLGNASSYFAQWAQPCAV